jgi:hypothetical protein
MPTTLSDDDRNVLELLGTPGLGVILDFNEQELHAAEQKLLENTELSLEMIRYYQGQRHAALALRRYIENVFERSGLEELEGDRHGR